jgi:hypothetical protein
MEKDADSVVGWGDWAFSASHEDLTCFGQDILPFHPSQLMHSSICPISFTSLSQLPFPLQGTFDYPFPLQLAVYQLGCPAASSFTILPVFDLVEKNKQSSIAVVAEGGP